MTDDARDSADETPASAPESGASTAEKVFCGGPDATAEWILLVEATDRAALETALADSAVASALKDAATEYDADRDCGVYRLQFALSREQLR